MSINPVSNTYINQRREQDSNSIITGAAGALIGGGAGALIGAAQKPDFVQFSDTAQKLMAKETKVDQKKLREIADVLKKDANAKLTDAQKGLLEFYELTEKSSNEIRNKAGAIGRAKDYEALAKRIDGKIGSAEGIIGNATTEIKTLGEHNKAIDAAAAPELRAYCEKNATLFEGKVFTTKGKAMQFIKDKKAALEKSSAEATKSLKKLNTFRAKIEKSLAHALSSSYDMALDLKNSFVSKKGSAYESVIAEFRNGKAKKYAAFGAVFAGLAAGFTAMTNSAKIKNVFVPVPVPVPVAVKGKCPECKPCEKGPAGETKAEKAEKLAEFKEEVKAEVKKAAEEARKED